MKANSFHVLRQVTRQFAQMQRRTWACCTPASEVQCLILTELYPDQALAIRELAERIASDAPWVSRAVEQLRRWGWVRRDPSPHDRRFVAVTLTEAGREQARRLQDELNRQSQALLEGLPPEEQEAVLRSLTWFAERLADERLWIALPTPNDSANGRKRALAVDDCPEKEGI